MSSHFLFLLTAVSVGSLSPEVARPSYSDVLIDGVPHVRQKPDFCGEACAEMYLRKLGRPFAQDDVFGASGLDPLLGRGCHTRELERALRRIGFKVGRVWERIDARRASHGLEKLWRDLHADLVRGIPSIVCTRYDGKPKTTEHFRLVLGYDSEKDEVIYHEPAEPRGSYRRMTRSLFLGLWPLKYDPARWTVVRLRLEPDGLLERLPREWTSFPGAKYARHLMELRRKLSKLPTGRNFTVVMEPPFVVVGDEREARVKERAVKTVRWATARLKRAFFKKDPEKIIDIWLFKDEKSYRTHARRLFGEEPSTPFGYYSSRHDALVMNIRTGGGTLVHEMVHPFMEANFPACPAWFNEGLASLYEQSGERNSRIHGYTNWRLDGLQKAIRADRLPTFETLTSTTSHEFYREDPGTNYSQARYLCYYLQERGRLRKFYHRFHARRATDPGGYRTLQEILGEDDMKAFQRRWEAFVLRLKN